MNQDIAGTYRGMTMDMVYANRPTRENARKGGTVETIGYAKARAELTGDHSALAQAVNPKKLPEYKTEQVDPENLLGSYMMGYYADEETVRRFAGQYNQNIDDFNELLKTSTNMRSTVEDLKGKLLSFHESAGKDAVLFDEKLLKQFEHDARFEALIEDFRRMRLISESSAQRAREPVDMLQTLYQQYEQERKRNSEEKANFEMIKRLMSDEQKQLKAEKSELGRVVDNLRIKLDQANHAISQHQSGALISSKQLSIMKADISKHENHARRTAGEYLKVVGERDQLQSLLVEEKKKLAQLSRKSSERSIAMTEEIQELGNKILQADREKAKLEFQITQLQARASVEAGNEIKVLQGNVSEKDTELAQLRQDKAVLEHDKNHLGKQAVKLKKEHKSAIEELEAKVKSLSDELDAFKGANSDLLKSSHKKSRELEGKKVELLRLGKQLDANAKELAVLKVKEESLQSHLDTANKAARDLTRMMDEKQTKAEATKAKYEHSIQQLEQELEAKKEKVRNQVIAIGKLRKEVNHLQGEATGGEKLAAKVNVQVQQKEERISQLEIEKNQANEAVNTHKRKLQEAERQLARTERTFKAASERFKTESEKQKQKITELEGHLETVQSSFSGKEREVEDLRSQFAASQDLIKVLKDKNAELVLELSKTDPAQAVQRVELPESDGRTETMINELQGEVSALKEALLLAHSQLQMPGSSMQPDYQSMGYPSLQADQKTLREENDALAAMYKRSSQQAIELNEQIAQLKESNQMLLEQINSKNEDDSDAEFALRQEKGRFAELNQQMLELKQQHQQELRDLDAQLAEESKKAAEARYQALKNTSAVQEAEHLEFANTQLQNTLTGLTMDLREMLTEEQYKTLMTKHFGQTQQAAEAELVEEPLPKFL